MSNENGFGRAQYEELINRYFIPSQAHLIMMAYRFAKYGHRGQERDGGGRYFDHPREASMSLLRQGILDHEIIISALLHDVMEDTFILTWQDLEYIFGSQVCATVKLVTKEPGMAKDEYFSRLAGGTAEAWLVKLADRLHNLSTLESHSLERRLKKVKETRQKILPLAVKLADDARYSTHAHFFVQEIETLCEKYEAEQAQNVA